MLRIYVLFFSFLIGAVLGSGVHCMFARKAAGESWLKGRSHCDSCGHVLGALDLIPIVSYLISRGRCRYCGAKIPINCLIAEVEFACCLSVISLYFVSDQSPRQALLSVLGIILLILFCMLDYSLLSNDHKQ